ncbi:MAG: sn-glycerol-3-phosphate ABC transporter substrate-binding protein UgpB [SAR324 cluster bacterium]|nr:sn-glycerol-3-phosphate ABC transporter substrate-binding protein UgpB [SAR324 cluster bacterium]
MKKRILLASLAAGLFLSIFSNGATAATEIQWWHAMSGQLGETVNHLVKGFNDSQSDYVLKAVHKGNYTETMTAAIAAFRAKQQPHIVQVFEVGTASMMAAKGAIYPVHELMADAGEPFNESSYLSAVIGYYTTTDGKLLSMPFNSSTPVLYWNKDAFKKAGLDRAPTTWQEVGEYSKKLIASGAAECGFTTGWQSWVQLENFGTWHNTAFASKENGFAGLDTEMQFNSPLHVRHIKQMADWQKEKIFVYGGRRSTGNPMFVEGKCAMLTNSSASYGGIKQSAKFAFGTSKLPYYEGVAGAPQNSIIGGATLWVLKGGSKEEYKGVAKFMTYLSGIEAQTYWHKNTGYVPITNAAYKMVKDSGYYSTPDGADRDIAILQMSSKAPTGNSRGLRLGNFVQARDIINEELEAIWAGKKTAQQGLDDAVSRSNALLRKFERANK